MNCDKTIHFPVYKGIWEHVQKHLVPKDINKEHSTSIDLVLSDELGHKNQGCQWAGRIQQGVLISSKHKQSAQCLRWDT